MTDGTHAGMVDEQHTARAKVAARAEQAMARADEARAAAETAPPAPDFGESVAEVAAGYHAAPDAPTQDEVGREFAWRSQIEQQSIPDFVETVSQAKFLPALRAEIAAKPHAAVIAYALAKLPLGEIERLDEMDPASRAEELEHLGAVAYHFAEQETARVLEGVPDEDRSDEHCSMAEYVRRERERTLARVLTGQG